MFQRTNSRLILDRDLPNPNPKINAPFKNMAELTWLDNDGSTHVTYGCRRSFAQFPNKSALFHYVGKTFNGNSSKRKAKAMTPFEKIERELNALKEELASEKQARRKAERALEAFRALLKS